MIEQCLDSDISLPAPFFAVRLMLAIAAVLSDVAYSPDPVGVRLNFLSAKIGSFAPSHPPRSSEV